MIVYNWPINRSGNYAFLNVMKYIGINITEEEMDAMPDFKNFIIAESNVRKKIKALKFVSWDKAIDKWIRNWQYVIWYTDEYNSNLSDIFHQYLNWKESLFFIFVEDLWDYWKILPAFGEQHGDMWYEYISKRNLWKIKLIRRIML